MRYEEMITATALGCLLAGAAVAAPQSGSATERSDSSAAQAEQTRANPATTPEAVNSTVRPGESPGGGDTGTADSSAGNSSAGNSSAGKERASRTAAAGSSIPTPMLMVLVPVAQPTTTQAALRDGCWAKLYTDEKYGGDALTLVGPVDMPTMTGPFGVNWSNQVESVQTGPRTTLTIYDEERYRDRAATIRPGQEVPDLEDEKLGFFEDFRSMKISCASAPNAT